MQLVEIFVFCDSINNKKHLGFFGAKTNDSETYKLLISR